MSEFKSGIYKITINDYYIYIGQSANIERRWNDHLYELKRNKHRNIKFQNVYNKHSDNIKFEIIEECDVDMLDEREMFYIEQFNTFNTKHGLNMSIGGDCGCRKYRTKEEAEVAALEYSKQYYQDNKERHVQYYRNNIEKLREYSKNWYENNKNVIRDYSKQYYQDNKERHVQYSKQYYRDNIEKLREYSKHWRQNNKNTVREKRKEIRLQKGILSWKEKFEIRYNLNRPLTNKEWDTWCNTKHKFKCYAIKFLNTLPNITFTIPSKK